MPRFARFIGIDYSGAKGPHDPVPGIKAFEVFEGELPKEVVPLRGRHWSRAMLADWLASTLSDSPPALVGLDHGFAFPKLYYLRHRLHDWPQFLRHFAHAMPTHQLSIEELRHQHRLLSESAGLLRLCEAWTAGAKSVFQFDMQGSVAKSTYAGLPWLALLRERLGERAFFWPFDGWTPPDGGVHVFCEVYPALYKRRYRKPGLGPDAFDAWVIVQWMKEMQGREVLREYFQPPLTDEERAQAQLEGWILGVR
ncbi:MAG: hypothetical protein K6346_08145 [Halothiobacillaceae bacterium]